MYSNTDTAHLSFPCSDISPEAIAADTQSLLQQLEAERESNGVFRIHKANKWLQLASLKPVPKMLFDVFWHEGELCILFADSNLGKSILAVQIGQSIASGKAIKGFRLDAPAQAIVYLDCELSEKQFEGRYTKEFTKPFDFSENFTRAELNPDAPIIEGIYEERVVQSLEGMITQTGARVLIIDNLTYLSNQTEKANEALPLMKHLKALKAKYGLSILALAHTPKRDQSKPITSNDLQGSKMVYNFIDSCFAIGASYMDKTVRYLKQIKQRNTEQVYDAENVCIFQIEKPSNFLGFDFIGHATEREHLREYSKQDKEAQIEQIKELAAQGKKQREIAELLNLSLGAVNKYLNQ